MKTSKKLCRILKGRHMYRTEKTLSYHLWLTLRHWEDRKRRRRWSCKHLADVEGLIQHTHTEPFGKDWEIDWFQASKGISVNHCLPTRLTRKRIHVHTWKKKNTRRFSRVSSEKSLNKQIKCNNNTWGEQRTWFSELPHYIIYSFQPKIMRHKKNQECRTYPQGVRKEVNINYPWGSPDVGLTY